jgi:hypothetical protein
MMYLQAGDIVVIWVIDRPKLAVVRWVTLNRIVVTLEQETWNSGQSVPLANVFGYWLEREGY